MAEINLLPPEKREKLKEKIIFFHIRNVGYIVIAFVVITLGLIFGTRYYLEGKLDQIETETTQSNVTLPSGETLSYSSLVNDINTKITFLASVQFDYIKWSAFLSDLANLVPNNVFFTQLTINNDADEIQISGQAILRDNFLQFKDNLDKSGIITEINSPISNLVKREDIQFSLTGKIVLSDYSIIK